MLIKNKIKKLIVMNFPYFYYKYLKNQAKKSMSVNTINIQKTIKIKYCPKGKYPTCYEQPPKYYKKYLNTKIFDKEGIPLYRFEGNWVYHPTVIIQYGLSEYGYYIITKSIDHLNRSKKVTEWLIKNQNIKYGYWYFPFNYKHKMTDYILKAPWPSSMVQGQAISLLTRVYSITKDKRLVDAALLATKMFDTPIEKNGLCSEINGYKIFEEYPTIPYSYTLNGFIFCVFGIYDLFQITENIDVKRLWNEAKSTLEYIIPLYDGDIMSTYCLSHLTNRKEYRNISERYHAIHIILLQNLQSIIPNETFKMYIKKWASEFGIHIQK